jgi:hypothetical protein
MNQRLKPNKKPDIQIAGLQIWVHGRQFSHEWDYWDINWVNVTIHCGNQDSDVWVTGPNIFLTEIKELGDILEKYQHSLSSKTTFKTMEPYLSIEFEAKEDEIIEMKVNLTSNPMIDSHQYIFEIKQSQLCSFVEEISKTLKSYPIKGSPISSS